MRSGWHVRDCGARALSYVLDLPVEDVKKHLVQRHGDFQLTGKQMRREMTEIGFQWTYTTDPTHVPDDALVVTRRGFYGVVGGVPNMTIAAPQCGYYTREGGPHRE